MKKNSTTIMLSALFCIAVLLAGCAPTYIDKDSDKAKTISVSIKIITSEKSLYNGKIAVKSSAPVLSMATYEALTAAKVSYSEIGGEYDNFSGYPKTEDAHWVCYINDEKVDVSEKQKEIKDGDSIVWRYEKVSDETNALA